MEIVMVAQARPARGSGIVVQAEQDHLAEVAVGHARPHQSLVQAHGPLDAGDAANAMQVGVVERGCLFDVLHLGVHHPQVGERGVGDKPIGARHQADEDGSLLRDE